MFVTNNSEITNIEENVCYIGTHIHIYGRLEYLWTWVCMESGASVLS